MPYDARIILDSVSEAGVRIVTMEMTYPLIVHNEDLRHRTHWKTDSLKFEQWLDAGRSVMSNRAIAPSRLRDFVASDPYIPRFVRSTKGMVGGAELSEDGQKVATETWIWARDQALKAFDAYDNMAEKIHKQHRNRLLIPFQFVTVVTTANAQWWEHWFTLRDHPNAQPDIAIVAAQAHRHYLDSEPQLVRQGEWHLPLITWVDAALGDDGIDWRKVSAARCARTSYMRQHEMMLPNRADLELYEALDSSVPAHDSPKEHVCTPLAEASERAGHLVGWASMRHFAA